jgi:crossover junction endodeoxyribonuclease RuvC
VIIIGLDTSLTATGVAVLQPEPVPQCAVYTIAVKPTTESSPEAAELRRMRSIVARIDALDSGPGPSLVAMEGPSLASRNGKAHERAGLWWLVYEHVTEVWQVPVVVIRPTARAKYATGSGNAGKDQVMLAAARRYPDFPITNNNEADAVILAAMGARLLGAPIDRLPAKHLEPIKNLS